MSSQRIQALKGSFILSLVLPLALAGCTVGEAGNPPLTPPAPEVTTAEVAVHELNDWADFTGRLEAVESVEIRARVGGFVESVHFVEGGRVECKDLVGPVRVIGRDVHGLDPDRDGVACERD